MWAEKINEYILEKLSNITNCSVTSGLYDSTPHMKCSILIGWGVKIAMMITQHKNKETMAGSMETVHAIIL